MRSARSLAEFTGYALLVGSLRYDAEGALLAKQLKRYSYRPATKSAWLWFRCADPLGASFIDKTASRPNERIDPR